MAHFPSRWQSRASPWFPIAQDFKERANSPGTEEQLPIPVASCASLKVPVKGWGCLQASLGDKGWPGGFCPPSPLESLMPPGLPCPCCHLAAIGTGLPASLLYNLPLGELSGDQLLPSLYLPWRWGGRMEHCGIVEVTCQMLKLKGDTYLLQRSSSFNK